MEPKDFLEQYGIDGKSKNARFYADGDTRVAIINWVASENARREEAREPRLLAFELLPARVGVESGWGFVEFDNPNLGEKA